MNQTQLINSIPLTEKTSALPITHSKAPFSIALRNLLWHKKFDCIALAFPERIQESLEAAVENLPYIVALTVHLDGETTSYVTVDPCDAYVEAVRQSKQRKLPIYFLEDETQFIYKEHVSLPDPYLLHQVGIEKYYESCHPYLKDLQLDEVTCHRASICSEQLVDLEKKYDNILLICDWPIFTSLEATKGTFESKVEFYKTIPEDEQLADDLETIPFIDIKTFTVDPNHHYFALGELPFYTGEIEKERFNPLELPPDYMELIKKIYIQTRDHYISKKEESDIISLTRLQIILQYIRNLAFQEGRLLPDLFEIIIGAKGVLGSYFAAKVLEAAKYYPYFDPTSADETLKISVDRIQTPVDEEPVEALNILQDEQTMWKSVSLKKEPTKDEQKKYRYQWDPRGMCSHLPEDKQIEHFNQRSRQKTLQVLKEGLSQSEKFTSSLKDGIDVRETLRHWHEKEIYVKEDPPLKKNIDTVILLFDSENDEKYPQATTWYAEHQEESTLTFFATNPFDKMIGPGIAECIYGGLSLLFPPRPVENIFDYFVPNTGYSHTDQLVIGACINSREQHISFLSFKPPSVRLKQFAKKYKKKLVWVPLQKYSQETLRKLRRFHILNGKKVRSWASRYIPE